MAYGYVIAQISVTDAETYPHNVAMIQPLVENFGGEFLLRGGRSKSVDGAPPGNRNVVIRFPSYETAEARHLSDDHAEAKALRKSASTSVKTIVEGVA